MGKGRGEEREGKKRKRGRTKGGEGRGRNGKEEGEKGLRRIRTGSGEREGDRDTEFPPLHFSPTFTTTKGETRKTFFWLYANDIADR